MYIFVETAARKTTGGANTKLCLQAHNTLWQTTLFGQKSAPNLKKVSGTTTRVRVSKYKDKNAWPKAVL